MLYNAFVELFVLHILDVAYFYLFDLLVLNVSTAQLYLVLGQVEGFLTRPYALLSAFGDNDSLLKLFDPNRVVFWFCVVLIWSLLSPRCTSAGPWLAIFSLRVTLGGLLRFISLSRIGPFLWGFNGLEPNRNSWIVVNLLWKLRRFLLIFLRYVLVLHFEYPGSYGGLGDAFYVGIRPGFESVSVWWFSRLILIIHFLNIPAERLFKWYQHILRAITPVLVKKLLFPLYQAFNFFRNAQVYLMWSLLTRIAAIVWLLVEILLSEPVEHSLMGLEVLV